MHPIILANFYKFFKEKNALSPETAILLTEEDFLELGLPDGFKGYFGFSFSSTIKKTKEGKYWFSIKNYKNSPRYAFILRLIFDAIRVLLFLILFINLFSLLEDLSLLFK